MCAMPEKKKGPSQFRFLKIYWLTAIILFRYFNLFWMSKIFGKKRLESKKERIHLQTAQQIKKNILELKGLFIKVGQMISIMTQFLPRPFTQELEGLQDSVPPASYAEIEERLIEEFQQPPEKIFQKFDKVPIASASLGQVHVAYSSTGQKLAVKVQYPDIEEIVRIDLKTLKRIFGFLNLIFPQYGLKKIYQEVREVLLEELDFKNEGKNLELIAKNLSDNPNLLFPKIHWEFSTSRVLALEFMEGVKISKLDGLKELGVEPGEVAKNIIHAYCKQIFIDGVYHADPHPGNFLVQASSPSPLEGEPVLSGVEGGRGEGEGGSLKKERTDQVIPKIIMMDFGAVARISEPMRKGIAKFIDGIIKRDNLIISHAMKEMGFISKTQDEEVFDKIVEFFYERLKDIKIEDIQKMKFDQIQSLEQLVEFRKLDISFRDLLNTFNVPKDWALLERALILLAGLTTHLDPQLDPFTIIIPYAETFVLGKNRTFADLVVEAVKEVLLSYIKLPTELHKTLRHLNQGEIAIASKHSKRDAQTISHSVNRLSYTLLGLGGLNLGYILQKNSIPHYEWGYYASGFFGFLLFVNLIRRGR